MNWLRSIDGWTWVKVACLMTFAIGVGLLKRRVFEQQLREAEEERQRERTGRFTDPFDD